jgi:hypothetical protein
MNRQDAFGAFLLLISCVTSAQTLPTFKQSNFPTGCKTYDVAATRDLPEIATGDFNGDHR